MGLLTIIRKQKLKEREIRVLLLGLDNAGKTTFLKRLLNEDVTSVSPTFGFQIKTIELSGFKLNIWDIGGQKTIRNFWRNYFEATDSIIWVVDGLDEDRLHTCKNELQKLLEEEKLLGANLLIIINKMDAMEPSVVVKVEDEVKAMKIKSHHWKVIPVSALTGKNVEKAINWLLEDLRSTKFDPSPRTQADK
ncbi:ADP-ribosylation factor Alp41 [Schizosaccharomyces japonicus yFS275]|uniref:ADP-ribosylation factor Alp41 n=1 Tax=Schizosaccharomyces japonicus (strain yFS275 / FY16936) TaxID=402676 RepID=B6JX55_SCHJY|nr:ADP-ribosylation factor Alp41 [Schizosaccharomyces japonicus yFS275]EEB05956.1 ADP-ribosylation factor Alp41 [Schizosaccharomyces japonicus yFS275]